MRFAILALVLMAQQVLGDERTPNHLEGAESPYLLQHLYNPVDWYPWGPEALEKAKREEKLIFVSVGYASCHWCHVMAEESFENPEIAEFLNQNFVSIKIDRESRPDLDAQFMLVTQAVSDGGGWPNTVLMTPDAAPFHGGTYYPPDLFLQLMQRATQFWQDEPDALNEQGSSLVVAISNYMTKREAAADLTPELSDQTARAVVANVDPFHGGIGTAPKFPNEPLFLFLLDQAERQSDPDILEAVTGLLDGMLMGGVHDQVGGGFHRYSVDPEWHVPHFEKMLYTQAMTGRLLVRAWAKTNELRYKRTASQLFDYVLSELRAPEGGFYSAQDADSLDADGEKVEGAFFTWAPEELETLGEDSALISEVFLVSPEGDLDGRNVLNLSELPGFHALALGISEQQFNERIDPLLDQMKKLRAVRSAPATDKKILVDWNAAMIGTLAEASHAFERPDYFEVASEAARYIVEEMMADGKLSRVSFEGNIGVAAQLSDYAALGQAFLALHDFTPDSEDRDYWLAMAVQMAGTIKTDFGAAETGYFTSSNFDGFTAQIPSNDSEMPSGNAMALALLAGITDRKAAPELELEAINLMAGLSGLAVKSPQQRASILAASDELQFGGTGTVRYGAAGAVRVEFSRDRLSGEIRIDLAIRDGWHVNSNAPLLDYLIATSLSIPDGQNMGATYPKAVEKSLGFSETPLSLYEGNVAITLKLPENTEPLAVRLNIQACSDEICLSPEEMDFTVW